jgi:hypothetical protein
LRIAHSQHKNPSGPEKKNLTSSPPNLVLTSVDDEKKLLHFAYDFLFF